MLAALSPPFLEAVGSIASIGFLGFVVGVFLGAGWAALDDPSIDPLKWGAWGSAWAGFGAIVYFLAMWAGLQ